MEMKRNYSHEIEISDSTNLQRLFFVLQRGIWLIGLALILGAGAAFGVSKLQTPVYEAGTQVIIARPSSSQAVVTDITQALNSQQTSQTYVELLSQPWALDSVSERVGSRISAGQINISVVTNTQIIDIKVEDPDPARAVLIANSLVQVLIEQNENIQSGRYTEAEKNLDTQIEQMQQQITDTQMELKQINADALAEQIANSKSNIQATQTMIATLQAEIAKFNGITAVQAGTLLLNNQNLKAQLLAQLDQQLAEYDALNLKLASDPLVQQDPIYASTLQSQLAEMGAAINDTRQQVDILGQEITWLTPLVDADALAKSLAGKNDELIIQQALLTSYQQTYTDLLITGKIKGTTDEITNLEKNISLYQQVYVNLLSNRETVRLNRMQNILNVVQINPALSSERPIRPTIPLNTVLGGISGLVLAVVTVLLMDFLDTTIKTQEDVERVLGLPVLGYSLVMDAADVDKEGPYVARVPRSPAAEAYRSLRTNLEFIGVDKPLKSVLISSPGASEGKTTIASNLAAVIAQSGKRVALLDADFRRPRIHHAMGMVNRVGLSDVFRDRLALKDVVQTWNGLSLSVVTSGGIPPNPAELLASEKMRQILDELESEFDLVIIDSTPTIVTDSQLIAARVDGVLLVLWPGRTHAEAARSSVEQYRRVGARLLGVVMNNIQPGQGYGYTPYANYHYYRYDHDEAADAKRRPNGAIKLPWKRSKRPAKIEAGQETEN